MPWRSATLIDTVPLNLPSKLYLGPNVTLPCYLGELRSWSTAIAGQSYPSITIHWLLQDTLPPGFTNPPIVPPYGYQAGGPGTRSQASPPMGQVAPLCAWAPDGTKRFIWIYEGGGIPANTFEATAKYWTR